ncbi:MAG: L-rhamnose catabolism isomerase [Rhodoferax sp.]|uniref:L-rhamnose catabolism isomerase n=1 Tax=Rhodoferax sp. TaxID=50421 RepID=UPI00272F9BE6|nr:L-rhamnose catabolism isomerase [Rhodoferax sp.]MDP1531171.1 L-rhamnose catabolism isomerase [Rhodoferax sp.]MDP1942221.1 L-rhamnose catabolism isomerase [Rhodoferax sp.]MDP3191637.1 L-rhamnose catabolism isomerase [Rhodoferax sp.]MDP3864794.1 L-rhamnose catabolism isomerase [Rhodoferax sp.]
MTQTLIDHGAIEAHNAKLIRHVLNDYDHLGEQLSRRGIDIEEIRQQVSTFGVAIPSWGTGTGGTRFARFPGSGEPRHVFDKMQDCGVIHQLTRATPTVSLHIPWDKCSDWTELRQAASGAGLGFDAMNSNTFSDQTGQALSYKFGSLSHTDPAVRKQAVEHNLECIDIGKKLGSKALTVWIGDGANFPGQQHYRRAFDRYLESNRDIYAALPPDWRMFLEHKMFEPAFYATVIQDWGSSYLAATSLGPKAQCLVDLGHHAPNVNIEMIVARLVAVGKLAGFHFNDSKYGDDDLDAGSVAPYRLFLVFTELVAAAKEKVADFNPAYMLDQSHNVTDPIESLMVSALAVQASYAQALIVDREVLDAAQDANDALIATQTLKRAFETDVTPLLQKIRLDAGAAIDPVGTFRASGYRQQMAKLRPMGAPSSGIV